MSCKWKPRLDQSAQNFFLFYSTQQSLANRSSLSYRKHHSWQPE